MFKVTQKISSRQDCDIHLYQCPSAHPSCERDLESTAQLGGLGEFRREAEVRPGRMGKAHAQ